MNLGDAILEDSFEVFERHVEREHRAHLLFFEKVNIPTKVRHEVQPNFILKSETRTFSQVGYAGVGWPRCTAQGRSGKGGLLHKFPNFVLESRHISPQSPNRFCAAIFRTLNLKL